MISSEEQLIDVFRKCGFDFTSNASDIAVRFPKELDWGWFQVLPFQLTRAFAGLGSVWKIPVNCALELDLPPTRYVQEFHPTGDVRENFEQAVEKLAALLGPGDPGKSTNVYERNWQVGFFRISVMSWPRELNRTSTNASEGRNPYLGISANISINPAFPFVCPSEDAGTPMRALIWPSKNYRLICKSLVYARRNLVSAPAGTFVAGLVPGAFLIRTEDRTVRIPLDQIQRAVHTRFIPDRFSGCSSIWLDTTFHNQHPVPVEVAAGAETHSLDQVANLLAQTIAKPLAVQECPDNE
jgi:hypothetical protein